MGKELKHLNRRELIDIIYQLKKSEQELQAENEVLRKQLETKRIKQDKAGSVADAAAVITDIFSNAQKTADVYLSEIEQRKNDIERDYKLIIAHANKKSQEIINKAIAERDVVLAETKRAYNLYKRCEAEIENMKAELLKRNAQE